MKTAIVYYSMGGNTAYAAQCIADKLGEEAELIEIRPVKAYPDKGFRKFLWGGKSAVMSEKPELQPYHFNGEEYERIIIGFPVWASRIAPPVRSFVEAEKSSLKGKKLAAFACQAGSGAEKALNGLKKLLELSEWESSLILNDPKDKANENNEKRITEFCRSMKTEE